MGEEYGHSNASCDCWWSIRLLSLSHKKIMNPKIKLILEGDNR